MKTEETTYHYEDNNYIGFVAYPEKELAPLVLIAHTWAGRDSFVQEKAKEVLYQRVAESKPLPYITNEAYFCEKKFYVDERVLIPRSPIAELISKRFEPWLNQNSINRVLEIGTGSGCIALSIAEAFSDIEVVATDISPDAIDVARMNTKAHGLEQQVEIIESDLFENVSGVFDLSLIHI